MKNEVKNRISFLCLVIFLMLLGLSLLQDLGWLRVSNLGVMIIYALIFFLPLIIYARLSHQKTTHLLKMRSINFKYIPFVLVISVAICLICGMLNIVGYVWFQGLKTTDNPTGMMSFASQNPLVLVLTMVILPAVTEELLLRGAVLGEYETYGSVTAVMLSSAIFALFHANPMHLLSLFVAGICYGSLTLLFRSVYPAMIAHLLNNGVALFLYQHNQYIAYIFSDALFVIFAIVMIFAILILALRMSESVIGEIGKRGKLKYKQKNKGQAPIHSISLLLFAIGCIAKMVYTYFI